MNPAPADPSSRRAILEDDGRLKARGRVPIVIFWYDAESDDGWGADEEIDPGPPLVESAGYLVHEATEAEPWWTIAGDISGDETNRRIRIPAGMVTEVAYPDV